MIQPDDYFILRQPTFPINNLIQFYTQLFSQPIGELLRQHYRHPIAQQAILTASPLLYERMQRWLAGETLPEQEKLYITLHKYLIRMCSRPTPYGLFSGCTIGYFDEHTQWRAGTANTIQTHLRLDTECMLALCRWITLHPVLRDQLLLFPNSSLYPVGTSLRYVEQQVETAKPGTGQRQYFISMTDADRHLSAILEAAHSGATIQELAYVLTRFQIEETEAVEFIEQLIEGQLLSFEIGPTVTGPDYLDRLINRIATLTGTSVIVESLRQLQAFIQQPNRLQAHTSVRAWFTERDIHLPVADLVQVDTFFEHPAPRLGRRVLHQLQRDLEKLLVLNRSAICPDLDEFKRRFYNRYEDEEIPLALAIDAEFGVGYGSGAAFGVGYAPLIDDLTLSTDLAPAHTSWDWWQTLVMDKYTRALRTTRTAGTNDEIVLTDDDLAYIGRHQTSQAPLPDSFYVFGTLVANSPKELDEGNFRFNLLACKGPSAINLMARFGNGHAELAQRMQRSIRAEEAYHPDVIMAEIVHLPENRVGNILHRPTLHQYEIPYMGHASVDTDHQIPLTDLMVSVRNDTLILRSKRLDRRVIPRLTNAHNFTQGLPIYRFLCDLQTQDAHLSIGWNWGLLRTQTYLPRVRYRSIILSRATWQIPCRELTPDNPLRLVTELTAAGLPNQFMLVQGDNELFISMHTPASLALLMQEIRRQITAHQKANPQNERRATADMPGYIRLIECLSIPEQCPLQDKRDRYTHELLIPFRNKRVQPFAGLNQAVIPRLQRKFSVGSEWFYLKVYTGEKTSDQLLIDTIYPTVAQLLKTQIIQEFFFVRYKDTDPHLRLRFRGNAHLEFYHQVVRAMEKALHKAVESGVVHRVQVDTYQRELERYSLEQMPLCERLFYYDSLSTLLFLAYMGDTFDENVRLAFAIRKIDRLLTGAGFPIETCHRILESLKERFFQEFGGTPILRHQLAEKYRAYRPLIHQGLSANFLSIPGLSDWEYRQEGLLQQLMQSNVSSYQLHTIIDSLIHMIVNRLFPSKQRAYELVLYYCLAKYYDSVQAQQLTSNA
ncbi:lantibiotic dehydratase [Spirosoma panaciterrae]|uniref:lantibiotic dehydratase n=1 Tax=Spirosoma panaciterrae TaxID=496058 RepID=UPI0003829795|nr:lantibiotic dehydratase [Spirosoma panaciterrae]